MSDALLLPLAQASADCYAPGAIPTWQSSLRLVHVYHSLVKVGPAYVNTFAFEGTSDFWEWMVDLLAVQIPVVSHPQLGLVHAGFLLDVQAVFGAMVKALTDLGWPPFYVTGHSKGADEATLAAALFKAIGHPPLATRVYEPARCGGADLVAYMADMDFAWTQTFNADGADLVTLVPEGRPAWEHDPRVVRLAVPDAYGIAQKHRIPAVIEAIGKLVT